MFDINDPEFKGLMPTPVELIANGFVVSHKPEYRSAMMKKFNAPAMNVFFINAASAKPTTRVFDTPNEAVAAIHGSGEKGRIYANGEYLTVAAASKLDLQCFSRKQPGKTPGRPSLFTEEYVAKKNAAKPEATSKAAVELDTTPNEDKPLF